MARGTTDWRIPAPSRPGDGSVRPSSLDVAERVLAAEDMEGTTVATGNAVLAAIAPADAICCAAAGSRSAARIIGEPPITSKP